MTASLHDDRNLLSLILDEKFRICLVSVIDDKLAKLQPQRVTFLRAEDRVEERLMRLIGTVISVAIRAGAWRLSECCRLPTDEHVTKYHASDKHGQRCATVCTLSFWI